MEKNKFSLKIFCVGQPIPDQDWSSILGDKYRYALPFEIVFTDKMEDAAVMVWDGAINPKMNRILPLVEVELRKNKILLLSGESESLYSDHPFVRFYRSTEVATIEVPGWSVLPEDILAALEICYQKITHV